MFNFFKFGSNFYEFLCKLRQAIEYIVERPPIKIQFLGGVFMAIFSFGV